MLGAKVSKRTMAIGTYHPSTGKLKKKDLISNLAPQIEAFINFKHSLGIKYGSSMSHLRSLDGFNYSHGNSDCLRKETVEGWINWKEALSKSQDRSWVPPIREFGRYLRSIGYQRKINSIVHIVNSINSVIGFLGGEKAMPLTDREVEDIRAQMSGEEAATRPRIEFEIGETVIIKDGAFANFEGAVESIDPGKGKEFKHCKIGSGYKDDGCT